MDNHVENHVDDQELWGIVSTTVATREQAGLLARRLVEGRYAACVQIAPVASVYRWQEQVTEEAEYLLTIKIRTSRFAEVAAAITADHPYEVPELVMTPITRTSAPYGRWLDSVLGKLPEGGGGT